MTTRARFSPLALDSANYIVVSLGLDSCENFHFYFQKKHHVFMYLLFLNFFPVTFSSTFDIFTNIFISDHLIRNVDFMFQNEKKSYAETY
jgi:hypothetical protein